MRQPLEGVDILWLIIGTASVLVVVASIAMMASSGQGNWFTLIGAVLTTGLGFGSFIAFRRDRRKRQGGDNHEDDRPSSKQ